MKAAPILALVLLAAVINAQEPATATPQPAPKPQGYFIQGQAPARTARHAEIDRYIRAQLGQVLGRSGLRTSSEAQAQYIIRLTTESVENRALFRLELVDTKDNAVIYAVNRVVFPGLLAETFMNDAVDQLAAAVTANQERYTVEGAINYSLIFYSADEGAEIWMGTGEGRRSLGVIQDGKLEAAYFPFELNSTVTVRLEKEGHWPKDVSIFLPEEPVEVSVPDMMVYTTQSLSLGISPTRQGARGTYRFNLLPDRLFVGGDVALWLQYPFKGGAVPIYHDELRVHMGTYLFLPEDFFLRIAAGLGVSTLQTLVFVSDGILLFNDFAFDPIWIALEWNLSAFSVFAEVRFPFILGEGGLLEPGFVMKNGPPWLTFGGTLKW